VGLLCITYLAIILRSSFFFYYVARHINLHSFPTRRSSDLVKSVFQNTWNLLNDQGIFLFDVHSLYHVKHNMVNNTFAEVTDQTSYIWFCNEGEEQGEMYHDLTFFTLSNNHYIRFDETHFQKVFSIET